MSNSIPPWRLDYGLLEIMPRLLVGMDTLLLGVAGMAATALAAPGAGTAGLLTLLAAMVLAPALLHDEAAGRAASRGRLPVLLAQHATRACLLLGIAWAVSTAGGVRPPLPLAWWAAWLAVALAMMLGVRCAAVFAIRRLQAGGLLTETIAIVGSGSAASALREALLLRRPEAVELLGIFPAEALADLLALGQRRRIDWILLAAPYAGSAVEAVLVSRLKSLSAPIAICLGTASPAFASPRAALVPGWIGTAALLPWQAVTAVSVAARRRRRQQGINAVAKPAFEFDAHDLASFLPVAASFGQERCAFVVTPNVDHLIRLHEDSAFRQLYAAAAFILLDSRFIAAYLRVTRGLQLPVCTGSDLTAGLFSQVMAADDRIVLVGGSAAQAQVLRERHGLRGLVHHNPPMGFIRDPLAVEDCLRFVESHSPFRFCLLAVGSPQQEQVAAQLQERAIARGLVLCVGASLDFLTGRERRAPRWLQRCGMEWSFRLAQSPRRLASRYLVRGPRVFRLLAGRPVRLRSLSAATAAPADHPDQMHTALPASRRRTG